MESLFIIFILIKVCFRVTYGAENIIVTVEQGKIEGFEDLSTGGEKFYTFFGIPYAKAPVGQLRFKEAEPPEKWDGVRDGKSRSPRCASIDYNYMLREGKFRPLGDEDCLHMNIYTKKISEKAEFPVMVYIHGGGYTSGGMDVLQGQDFLDENVVLVTIQYRLGFLGFLWTEDAIFPSNLGLKDQTMALKWINANIYKFGGDPQLVTIFGNSAGGGSVHAHLVSHYSKGLFSRAIMQSGNLLCPFSKKTRPREVAMQVGENLGCFSNSDLIEGEDKSIKLLNCLRKAKVNDILRITRGTFEWSFLPKRSVPYYDGDFFSDEFEVLVKKGKMKPIDLLIGVVKDEGAFVSNAILVQENQRRAIKEDFNRIGPLSLAFDMEEDGVGLAKKAYDYYVGGIKNNLEDYHNLTKMYSDRHFKFCCDITAQFYSKLNRKNEKRTFFYELHHKGEHSLGDALGNHPMAKKMIFHTDELRYLLINFKPRNEEDAKIAKIMTKLWTNFATYGDPTPDMSMGFKWEEFSVDSPRHLKIVSQPYMEDDLRKKERNFWISLPMKANKILFGADKEEL